MGVTGHRLDRVDPNRPSLIAAINRVLDAIIEDHPEATFTVMSPLAEGADRLVARMALERLPRARLQVPLPLPYEIYAKGFGHHPNLHRGESIEAFQALLGRAFRYVEMPLKFATTAELEQSGPDGDKAQARQFALAALTSWRAAMNSSPSGTAMHQGSKVALHRLHRGGSPRFHNPTDFRMHSSPCPSDARRSSCPQTRRRTSSRGVPPPGNCAIRTRSARCADHLPAGTVMSDENELIIEQIEIGPMQNFTYIVGSRSTREVALVDPAWDIDGLIKHLDERDYKLTAALVTHYHPDHIGGGYGGRNIAGLADLIGKRPVKAYAHNDEAAGVRKVTGLSESDLVKVRSGDTLKIEPVRLPRDAYYPALKPHLIEEDLATRKQAVAKGVKMLAAAQAKAKPNDWQVRSEQGSDIKHLFDCMMMRG
ncbi:MAG: MBL fold metallo-hydrolase [Gammaproteobacteria bacterium]|nr:MBL fold metallo-hydrolase [Gammaproteobacteria bacterium]